MNSEEPSRNRDHRRRRRPRPERPPATEPPASLEPFSGLHEPEASPGNANTRYWEPQAPSVIAVAGSSRASLEVVNLDACIARPCGAKFLIACLVRPPLLLCSCLTRIGPACRPTLAEAKAREVRQQVATLPDLEPPESWDFCCTTGSAQAALRPWRAGRSVVAVVTRGPWSPGPGRPVPGMSAYQPAHR
jgi:hypothetical protein